MGALGTIATATALLNEGGDPGGGAAAAAGAGGAALLYPRPPRAWSLAALLESQPPCALPPT